MSKRKTYKITIEPQYVSRIITTRSADAVDVVTKTFMNVPSAYKIETV